MYFNCTPCILILWILRPPRVATSFPFHYSRRAQVSDANDVPSSIVVPPSLGVSPSSNVPSPLDELPTSCGASSFPDEPPLPTYGF
jgi:hypothetical protein